MIYLLQILNRKQTLSMVKVILIMFSLSALSACAEAEFVAHNLKLIEKGLSKNDKH